MKKILVCLIAALFVFSGVCLAALTALDTYRDTPQDPAANKPAVDQAVQDASKPKTTPPEDHAWMGDVTAGRAAEIAKADGTVTAVKELPANLKAVLGPVIGIGDRPNFKYPSIKVVKQSVMGNVRGPIRSGDLIVIGEDDWSAMKNRPDIFAHEYMAAFAAQNAQEDAHALALQLEEVVKTNLENAAAAKPAEQRGTYKAVQRDSVNAYLAASNVSVLPATATVGRYEIKINPDRVPKAAADAYVAYLKSRFPGITIDDVRVSLPPDRSMGDVVVTAYAADKTTLINTGRIDVTSTDVYRAAGLLNLAFISANIPANLTAQTLPQYQPLLDTLRQQYRDLTGSEVPNLPPNPNPEDIDKAIRRLPVALPAPTSINYNTNLEEQMANEIFASAA